MDDNFKEYLRDESYRQYGNDPSLFKKNFNPQQLKLNTVRLRTGRISKILKEPIYSTTFVEVEYLRGGMSGTIQWPGANVEVTNSGSRGQSEVPHGLYLPPTEGWMVLIGFEEGEHHRPYIIATYPYATDSDPQYDNAHINPLTRMGFDSDDTILGHFSGSYFVIRGNKPLPADIEIFGKSKFTVFCQDIELGKDTNREPAVLGNQNITALKVIVDQLSATIDQITASNNQLMSIITQLTTPGNIVVTTAPGVAQFNPATDAALAASSAAVSAANTALATAKTTVNNLETPGQALGTNSPMLSTQVKISSGH